MIKTPTVVGCFMFKEVADGCTTVGYIDDVSQYKGPFWPISI